MTDPADASDDKEPSADEEPDEFPALFATIHFKSEHRPNGYTAEEIAEINRYLNSPEYRRRTKT